MNARSQRRVGMRDRGDGERFAYNVMLAAGFAIFLAAALLECLLPWRWSAILGRWSRKSPIEEALDAARTTIPFAFMG